MKLSFISPRKKYLFTTFTKFWLLFILFTFVMLNIINLVILYKNVEYKKVSKKIDNQTVVLEENGYSIDKQIKTILIEKALAEEIYANNLVLKDSIKNLFDLVPDQITLKKVLMEKSTLVIYGVTPTKKIYNSLLSVPLKSIFNNSNTKFSIRDDGWYDFISTNKITNQKGLK